MPILVLWVATSCGLQGKDGIDNFLRNCGTVNAKQFRARVTSLKELKGRWKGKDGAR